MCGVKLTLARALLTRSLCVCDVANSARVKSLRNYAVEAHWSDASLDGPVRP